MFRAAWFPLIVLAASAIAIAQPAEPGTGLAVQVLSDGPKLRRDAQWPASSPIFDQASKEVRLHAARNEFAAFQVLLRSSTDDLKRITCEVSDLQPDDAAGKPITRENIELFRAWYIQVTTPSYTGDIPGLGNGEYPDPLVPLSAPKAGAPFDLQKGKTENLWVDLFVPPGTAAGAYRGTLLIRAADKPVVTLTMRLKVWHFALPEETHFKSTFAYSPEFLRWGFRNPPDSQMLKIESNYHQVAQRHRANLMGYLNARYTPEQWAAWQQRYGKYIDGSAFVRSPGKGVGCYMWRVGVDATQDDAAMADQIKTVTTRLREKEWLDHFVVSGFDEPKPDKYPLVRKLGQLTRESSGGQLKHFLPGANPHPVYQDYVDIWDGVWTQKDLPALAERRNAGQQIWFCGGLGAPANPVADSLPYSARAWAWVAWKYGFEGFEMWHAIYWVDKFNLSDKDRSRIIAELGRNPDPYINVWKNPAPLTFDEGRKRGRSEEGDIRQNGGAVFFYPGYDIGLPEQVVVSLRTKDFRRGAQDYEYLWLLQQAGQKQPIDQAMSRIYNPDAITIVRGGSPRIATGDLGVTTDEQTWEAVHIAMGEQLDKIAPR